MVILSVKHSIYLRVVGLLFRNTTVSYTSFAVMSYSAAKDRKSGSRAKLLSNNFLQWNTKNMKQWGQFLVIPQATQFNKHCRAMAHKPNINFSQKECNVQNKKGILS